MTQVRNSYLHKEKKYIREGINEGKVTSLFHFAFITHY